MLPSVSGLDRTTVVVEHLDVVAGHGGGRRTAFHRQQFQPKRIGGDRPAGLGLPPMVDHRHADLLLRPAHRIRVGALAGEEQAAQAGNVVALDQLAVRVFLLDGAERRRRREQHRYLVLGHHPPEGAGIGRAHWLALVQYGRAAVDERRIDDVGVADHPADVGRRPIDFARRDAIDVLHRPFERDHVAAIVADDALGLAGGSGGIEDVERVGGGHRDTGLGAARRPAPSPSPRHSRVRGWHRVRRGAASRWTTIMAAGLWVA